MQLVTMKFYGFRPALSCHRITAFSDHQGQISGEHRGYVVQIALSQGFRLDFTGYRCDHHANKRLTMFPLASGALLYLQVDVF